LGDQGAASYAAIEILRQLTNSGGGAAGVVPVAGSLTFPSGIQQGHSMPTLPPGP
jgi:hypothetical protein